MLSRTQINKICCEATNFFGLTGKFLIGIAGKLLKMSILMVQASSLVLPCFQKCDFIQDVRKVRKTTDMIKARIAGTDRFESIQDNKFH